MYLYKRMCLSAGLGLTDEDGNPDDDEIESFYNDTTVGEDFEVLGTVGEDFEVLGTIGECKTFADGITLVDFFKYTMDTDEES